MFMRTLRAVLLALLALVVAGLASAQSEPTVDQIYRTAQSGQVDKARQMTQEVLRSHPQSAKAHFVMAELDAAKGNLASARDELAQAESLAPGLPFARPDAVQALRSRVSGSTALQRGGGGDESTAPVRAVPAGSSFPWGMVLIAAVIVAVAASVMRLRAAKRSAAQPMNAPGRFGAAASPGWGRQAPGYGPQPGYDPQPGYGAQPGYGPQPGYGSQPGRGGQIMGGLATGLAVGAGALAAQEIGRRMLGEHGQQGFGSVGEPHAGSSDSQLARDAGLGSVGDAAGGSALPEDFGIADGGGSWDDGGGSFDVGGGGDGGWDS